MATSPGAPPVATTKKEVTPEQKRLYGALAVAGVLALLVGGRFVMGSRGGSSSDATPTATTASASLGNVVTPDAGATGTTPAGAIPPTATTISTSGVGNPASLLPLSPYRRDPFQPKFVLPAPTPIPPPPLPTPTPIPPPVVIPAPPTVFVPPPGSAGAPDTGFGLPSVNGGGSAFSQGLNLPAVVIPRLNARNTKPTDAFPPPRSASGGGGGVVSPSFNKRLSGIVIGSGVRAILEIDNGSGTPKSYVVQPGDVVEGVTVLNIRRFNEGSATITRMLIRENGGERYVDLKPGPPRAQVGADGLGGDGVGSDESGGSSNPRGAFGFGGRGGFSPNREE